MKGGRTAIIAEVAKLRLLADPKKLRIFEALREAPASPLELAKRFGFKPTALYHHFARLQKAGLIEVARTRRVRGVTERLFRPAVTKVVVDRAMVRGDRRSRSVAAVMAAATTILQVTGEDAQAATLDPTRPLADLERSELATIVARVSPAGAKLLMKRLRSLFALAERLDGTGDERVRLTLALVPVQAPARAR